MDKRVLWTLFIFLERPQIWRLLSISCSPNCQKKWNQLFYNSKIWFHEVFFKFSRAKLDFVLQWISTGKTYGLHGSPTNMVQMRPFKMQKKNKQMSYKWYSSVWYNINCRKCQLNCFYGDWTLSFSTKKHLLPDYDGTV